MSVTAARGFRASGGASGIKASGALDTALVVTVDAQPVTTVGVFTSNLVAAAPVQVCREHLAIGTSAVAVILNSGNANAATGVHGLQTSRSTCHAVASALGVGDEEVLVCSTGLIGIPMDASPIIANLPSLIASLEATPAGGTMAADAIMTTDTVRKEAVATCVGHTASGNPVDLVVGGMAKGAAMLSPAMATMLAVVTTDAAVDPVFAQHALSSAVADSFNSLSVDGCRSTNDTVILMCSAAAEASLIDDESHPDSAAFQAALTEVCRSLAMQMADDAEGATKTVTINIHGARTKEEAVLAARQVANSNLVKCSFYGRDPYWGRVLSELGVSGAQFNPDDVSIAYGGVTNCVGGIAAQHDEAAIAAVMEERAITLDCNLGAGTASTTVITTDLTHAYIDENMGTS